MPEITSMAALTSGAQRCRCDMRRPDLSSPWPRPTRAVTVAVTDDGRSLPAGSMTLRCKNHRPGEVLIGERGLTEDVAELTMSRDRSLPAVCRVRPDLVPCALALQLTADGTQLPKKLLALHLRGTRASRTSRYASMMLRRNSASVLPWLMTSGISRSWPPYQRPSRQYSSVRRASTVVRRRARGATTVEFRRLLRMALG